MCVNNLSKVALDSAAAGIEPATSSRESNALTIAPPSVAVMITNVMSNYELSSVYHICILYFVYFGLSYHSLSTSSFDLINPYTPHLYTPDGKFRGQNCVCVSLKTYKVK